MDVEFHKQFKKRYELLKPSERVKCDKRLLLFRKDPFHLSLRNHALRGAYAGFRSIDITGDVRAVYEPIGEEYAYFVYLGTHSELYS